MNNYEDAYNDLLAMFNSFSFNHCLGLLLNNPEHMHFMRLLRETMEDFAFHAAMVYLREAR